MMLVLYRGIRRTATKITKTDTPNGNNPIQDAADPALPVRPHGRA